MPKYSLNKVLPNFPTETSREREAEKCTEQIFIWKPLNVRKLVLSLSVNFLVFFEAKEIDDNLARKKIPLIFLLAEDNQSHYLLIFSFNTQF